MKGMFFAEKASENIQYQERNGDLSYLYQFFSYSRRRCILVPKTTMAYHFLLIEVFAITGQMSGLKHFTVMTLNNPYKYG